LYCGVIGFEPQANLGTAAFASAGGYHHHLGFNVWNGRGVGPAPEHSVGLRHWTVALPPDALAELRPASRRRASPSSPPATGSSCATPGGSPPPSSRCPRPGDPRSAQVAHG
jgi:catechol-2,3-dioxygenase